MLVEEGLSAGMVVLAASGDNDSSDGGPTPANVDLPAAAPHVIGCGGTNKTRSAETVWNDAPSNTNGDGTGGGYSSIFPMPRGGMTRSQRTRFITFAGISLNWETKVTTCISLRETLNLPR